MKQMRQLTRRKLKKKKKRNNALKLFCSCFFGGGLNIVSNYLLLAFTKLCKKKLFKTLLAGEFSSAGEQVTKMAARQV